MHLLLLDFRVLLCAVLGLLCFDFIRLGSHYNFCVFTNPRRPSRRESAGKIDAVAAAAICSALECNTTLKYLKFNGEFSGISRLFCCAFMFVRFSASTAFPRIFSCFVGEILGVIMVFAPLLTVTNLQTISTYTLTEF